MLHKPDISRVSDTQHFIDLILLDWCAIIKLFNQIEIKAWGSQSINWKYFKQL